MDKRLFVEKKEEFQIEAKTLLHDLQTKLQVTSLSSVRMIQVYDVFDVSEQLFIQAQKTVFTERVTDIVLADEEMQKLLHQYPHLCVEALPGQFDQRADSAEAALFLLDSAAKSTVKSAQLYLFNAELNADELAKIQSYLVNPIDSWIKDLALPLTHTIDTIEKSAIPTLAFFNTATAADFQHYKTTQGLAMEVADLLHIQAYYIKQKRNPTETELKVFDTYWSDHCRHTTFETELKKVDFQESQFAEQLQATYNTYLQLRKTLHRENKPQTLMDMATIFGRYQRANNQLNDLEVSDEINACSVEIEVDVNGKKEPWLLMFKNETHNHPTEIEPFGGASTCIGGAIRDPLSGRSYVYQAMRITGAGNILAPIADTLAGKLPQQVISKGAAKGYSSYGNQIGLATTYVKEYFHEGFVAKRMEVGAVVGAAPKEMVVREKPTPTDVIILLGGKTGRDGIGGATGSSKTQNANTIETAGSEVQKGNAIEERKIQRLFRNPRVTQMIKKSNDFGAGGVSVAIGELADGVDINLDLVPLKYQGLTGTEIAISESQERMAVVVRNTDMEQFIQEAAKENILAVKVAEVTEKAHLIMRWQGQVIVDIERSFLDTNGARSSVEAKVVDSKKTAPFMQQEKPASIEKHLLAKLADMNTASQKGLQTLFDSSIGRSTVLQPIGGKFQITPAEASVQKLPVKHGITNTVSVLAHGYNPYLSEWSQYHGAAYAIIEATARIVATGANWEKTRFSYQEYFERMDKQAERFGKPVAALLGALEAQSQLGLPSIGGKDSMSGTYEDLTVPPSLLAFGVTTTTTDRILSPEFKTANEYIYYLPQILTDTAEIPFATIKENFNSLQTLNQQHELAAAISLKDLGVGASVALMMFGNKIGAKLNGISADELFHWQYGGFIFTSKEPLPASDKYHHIGMTTMEYQLTINDEIISGERLQRSFEQTLEPIYPTLFEQEEQKDITVPTITQQQNTIKAPSMITQPLVYIPVFPGTNCEYDTAKAFEKAGAKTEIVPFKTLSAQAIETSLTEMVEMLEKAQIFMLSGGFSAADEPDGSGKFIVNILLNAKVRAAIEKFIAKGGLILGICNGFQALVKAGLLPYGEFEKITDQSPTLFRNDANQHVAKMVQTKIVNTNSPWLSKLKVGDVHTIPVSHGEGKFHVSQSELQNLLANGQIVTQYVDFSGTPTMDSAFNPNGSTFAIEGIVSTDGQILGKMGHSERFENGLFQNIPGEKEQQLFESAVAHFTK